MVTCAHIMGSGLPCAAPALSDSALCRWHDERPETVRSRLDASRRGGRASHAPARPEDLEIDPGSASDVLAGLRRRYAAALMTPRPEEPEIEPIRDAAKEIEERIRRMQADGRWPT